MKRQRQLASYINLSIKRVFFLWFRAKVDPILFNSQFLNRCLGHNGTAHNVAVQHNSTVQHNGT